MGKVQSCVPYVKHVPSTSVKMWTSKSSLFGFRWTRVAETLRTRLGTILFRTKPICSKRMRRLVSIRVFCILSGNYIAYRITQMVIGFPYDRTQHVRGMCFSIVSVIYYTSTRFCMSCDVR